MDPRFADVEGREPVMVGDLPFQHYEVGAGLMEIRSRGAAITQIVVNEAGMKDLISSVQRNVVEVPEGTTLPTKIWGIDLLFDPKSRWNYNVYARMPKATR